MAVAQRLETGICHINSATVHDEAQMPFGGVKASGYGRLGGVAAINRIHRTALDHGVQPERELSDLSRYVAGSSGRLRIREVNEPSGQTTDHQGRTKRMTNTTERELQPEAWHRRAARSWRGRRGVALAAASRGAFAAGAENGLKVGFISPRTGALAGFGQTDGYVLDLARAALKNGLTIGGKTYAVEILDRDTQSDPSRASQLAKTLINSDAVDLMIAVSTPETINPVADACEAAGVPCLSTVMPWQAWYFGRGAKPGQPSPFKWTYHFGFGVGEFFQTYVSQWKLIDTNKKVGVLYPNDADGNAIRANLAPLLTKQGYTIVDPGPYEDGTTDYSAQIALFKKEKCEIFNSFPIPPDFAAFWRQAAQQGYTKAGEDLPGRQDGPVPRRHRGARRAWREHRERRLLAQGVPLQVLADGRLGHRARGRLREGLRQAMDAAARREPRGARRRHGGLEGEQPIPRTRRRSPRRISTLNTVTIAGKVDFTSGPVPNVASGPIIGTQWVKAASRTRSSSSTTS